MVAWAVAGVAGGSAGAADAESGWPAVAQVVFRGTSTLHDFAGRVGAQPFLLVVSTNTWSAQAEVIGEEMDTAHERRDRNLRTMFETARYPRLSGWVKQAPRPGAEGQRVTLTLKIRDVARELPVTVSSWVETVDEIKFRAVWEVSLKEFRLKPPSVLGVIRVGDKVRLEAEVTAHRPGVVSAGEARQGGAESRP